MVYINMSDTLCIPSIERVNLEFTQDNYNINEDMGPVEVCGRLSATISQDVPITMTASDLTPVEARGQSYSCNHQMFIIMMYRWC